MDDFNHKKKDFYRIDDSIYRTYHGNRSRIDSLITWVFQSVKSSFERVVCPALSEAKQAAGIALCDGIKKRIQQHDEDDHDSSNRNDRSY